MPNVRTHYDNLQVSESACSEVIRGAYKFLCQKWHPDKHPGDEESAGRIIRLLNEAYAVLSDPDKRREHDQWVRAQRELEKSTVTDKAPGNEPPEPPQERRQDPEPLYCPSSFVGILFWATLTTISWMASFGYLVLK